MHATFRSASDKQHCAPAPKRLRGSDWRLRGSDWRLRGSDWRLRCAFFLALLCTASSAFAARPFVTDDARIVDPGGCQVESFHKSQRKLQETEFWFLPGCNLFGRFELTTGGIWVGSDTPGDSRTTVMQLKTLLKPLETTTCPFKNTPKTNERPHWVRPELVAQIKFTEWTADAKLRHPVYLGLRDDKEKLKDAKKALSRLRPVP